MAYVAQGNLCRAARPPGGGLCVYERRDRASINIFLILLLVKFFIIAFLLVFPSVSLAYSLEPTPPQGSTIIDSGELECYGIVRYAEQSDGYRFKRGGESYKTKISVYCRNSFSSTGATISKIELDSASENQLDTNVKNLRVEVNEFPQITDSINTPQTKVFTFSSSLYAGASNFPSAVVYYSHGVLNISKVFFKINGEERSAAFYLQNNEFRQNEKLSLFLVDVPSIPSNSLSEEQCIQRSGFFSIPNGSTCTCKDNYMFNVSNQCVPAGNECILRYGDKAIPSSVISCGCANGYHMDVAVQKCVQDAKPVMTIPLSVKKWVDDNYSKGSIPCSSNTAFSASELKICDMYNNSFTRQKYEWEVEQSITPIPAAVTPVAVPVLQQKVVSVAPISPPMQAKQRVEEEHSPKPLDIAATTTEVLPTALAVVVDEKPIPTPTQKPKSFWSRIVSWLKFW